MPLPMRQGVEVPCYLAAGQTDEFILELNAGQFLHLVMQQQGVDIVSTLSDPDDRLILRVDGPTADQGAEEMLAVAEVAGCYRLRVESYGKDSGDYTVRIEGLRAAGDLDRRLAAAARVFADAETSRLGEDPAAVDKYQKALRRFQALGDRQGEANALRGLARVTRDLPDSPETAEHFYRQALPILREVGDVWQEASVAHELGLLAFKRGDLEPAIDLFERALDLWQQLGRSRGAAKSAFELGKLNQRIGKAQEALTFFELALAHWRDFGETPEIATTVFQRGESFLQLGKYAEALDDFERALQIWQESGAHRWQMTALKSINQVHQRQGRLDLAMVVLEQAWEPLREINDPRAEALLWNSTGLLHHQAGRYEKALDAFGRALEGFRWVSDRAAQAVVLHNIGNTLLILEKPCDASSLYRQALNLFDEVLGQASVTYKQVTTLLRLAKAERSCSGSSAARALGEQALDMLEDLRSRTASLDYRSSYLATQHWFYDEYVDLLMDLHRQDPSAGYDRVALAVSERARARSLLDGLMEVEADLRRGADPKLIDHERELARQLQAVEQGSLSLDLVSEVDEESFDERLRHAEVKKRALLRRLSEVQARIHLESPRYATLTTATTLDANDIQKRVLDPETLLLEYDLGEERSFLWAVTPDALTSYELPAGSLIDSHARRAYKLLKLTKRRRSTVPAEMALAELGELLLGPVADLLREDRRLLVVGEGALQYIPFAALTVPGATEPVLASHEVVNMPSASAMAILRQQLSARPLAPGALALIADPVFQGHDPRVRGAPAYREEAVEAAPGSRFSLDLNGHERLVYSQHEAQAILRHFPSGQVKQLLGFEATREAVVDSGLGGYRVLHFATHGVLDEEHPELSRLVLSLVDEAGNQRESGFLFGHELYNLDLPVELVVLSACQTALGKEIRGEGLVGLTQSFFHAGAARVLVSLWNVDDYATAELMSRFYLYLSQEGRRPAAALRQAQIDMWREARPPYYWAPFVLRGEWR